MLHRKSLLSADKMKIAFFVYEFEPLLVGGLGVYAIEITKKFVELGNDVHVFTMNDGTLKEEEEINKVRVFRPKIFACEAIFPWIVNEDLARWGTHLKFFADIFAYNFLTAEKFLKIANKEKFDVVAFHDWLSAFSGVIIENNLKEKIGTVFHIHSTEQQRSLGGGSETIKHIEKKAVEGADGAITVSYAMKDHLKELGYPIEKIEVVYNGVDAEKYSLKNVDWNLVNELKKRYGIKEDEKVVFFIGRLTWVKGVYNLVHALPLVLQDFPNVKLIILGKGEQYKDLLYHVKMHNLQEKVVIRSEWVSEKERIAHYALADLCVFPSLSEPFGIVCLEAMAMEKPVVVGAAGISGLREQVIPSGEKRTGVHVNGNDPKDIAWGIKVALENWEEAKRWGKNGRKRVLENFTWDKVAKKTLEVYEKVLENQ